MGDTGSLALGGIIASITTFSKNYFLIMIVGVMFVLTALSVILQVGYYKMTKKRIFKMAPLQHHFEKCGWSEEKIVFVFSCVTVVGCVIAVLPIVLNL
jgi:phospho-N-acetylmuramoyl-pentapeptide-transferase